MNMQRSFSMRNYISRVSLTILLFFGIALLIYFGAMSYFSAKATLREFSISMQNWENKLTSDLENESDFNRIIVASDPNFALLSTSGVSDASRLPSLHNLRQIIDYHDSAYCVSMISDFAMDYLYYFSNLFPTKNTEPYRSAYRQVGESAAEANAVLDQWYHKKIADEGYLILQNRKGKLALCTMLSLEKYTIQNPIPTLTGNSIVSIFSSDAVVSSQDSLENLHIGLSDLQECASNNQHLGICNGNLVLSYYIDEYQTGIAVVTPLSEFVLLASERFWIVIIFLTILTLVFAAFYAISSRILLIPIIEISNFSKKVQQTHDYSISRPSRIKEVQEIQEALASLSETISELEAVRRAEEEVKLHALLQYYQLQTRSHFFINCLKSLYGMLENQRIGKMKLMIIAFSNHLRYLFHDNISTVPLSYELQEIEDYYQILSLDSGKIFLLNVDVEEDLKKHPVPPLIIQTFLENSFKYNDGKKGMVVFSVKIRATMEHNASYMCIHMQDNGEGYPKAVLDVINQRVNYSFEENHVGINNLKYRLSILYGNRYSFAFYNLPAGGACSIISIPLG